MEISVQQDSANQIGAGKRVARHLEQELSGFFVSDMDHTEGKCR